MSKRRSNGRDYRTKEFKDSPYAPKNNKTGATPEGQAAIIPVLIGLLLYYTHPPFVQSLGGTVLTGIALLLLWAHIYKRILRREQRIIQNKKMLQTEMAETIADEEEAEDFFSFDQHTSPTVSVPLSMPKAFEHEIAQLIQTTTGKRTRVCGGAGDGGVDVEVFDTAGRVVGIVQCKAFLKGKALPPGYVRELYAVKIQRGVNSAYLVTTAHVSDGTKREADKLGVRVIDGTGVEKLREKQRIQRRLTPQPTVVNQRVATMQPSVRNLWAED